MHKKVKGTIAELAVAQRLIEDGWRVSQPIGENHRYDLVAEHDGKFVRIQVKYVTPKNGALNVNCRSSNNWSVLHYSADEIDIIAAYDAASRRIYFVPVSQINHSLITLRLEETKNNQKAKINLAENFTNCKFT